jgi:hypothetical protein
MYFKSLILLIFCLVVSVTAALPESAVDAKKKATFKELTVVTSETHLLVFCTLNDSLTPEMTATLHSGIPLKYSFFIELYKTTKNWPDEQIAVLTFQHNLSYDALKENYRITLEEDNNMLISLKSLIDAQKAFNELNGAKVVSLKQLIPDNHYKLKVRAELYQKTLPLSLHDALPFLSWWDLVTDWHTIEFTY